jgi:hypothetical protein
MVEGVCGKAELGYILSLHNALSFRMKHFPVAFFPSEEI